MEMDKYLQLHNYSENQEAQIAIYNLQGKNYKWWSHLKQVEILDEKYISWRRFQIHFKKDYLSQQFYEKIVQEFFEHKLGNMSMEDYEKRFLYLLGYVEFINDEKVKAQ